MRILRRDSRSRRRYTVRHNGSTSFTSDVRTGGLCIRLMKVLPVDSALEGSIQVEGQEVPFAGRVAWIAHGDSRLNLLGKMGARYTHISADFPPLLEPALIRVEVPAGAASA